MPTDAEVDTSFPLEDGLLSPLELIIQCFAGHMFKCHFWRCQELKRAKGGFTKHPETKTKLIALFKNTLDAICASSNYMDSYTIH